MFPSNAGQQQVEPSLPEEQGSHPFILKPDAWQALCSSPEERVLSERAPNNGRQAQRQQGKENIYIWYRAWAHRKGSQGWRSWQLPVLNKQCREMLAHITEPWVIPWELLTEQTPGSMTVQSCFLLSNPHWCIVTLLEHCKWMGLELHLCLREKNISRPKSYLLQGRKAQTYWMCHCKCWKLAPTASSLHSHLLTYETSSYFSPGFYTLNP